MLQRVNMGMYFNREIPWPNGFWMVLVYSSGVFKLGGLPILIHTHIEDTGPLSEACDF